MRFMFRYFAMLIALFTVGCNTLFEEDIALSSTSNYPSLNIGIEGDTRTFVENNTTLCWHADDRFSIFLGNTVNVEYRFDGEDGDVRGTASAIGSSSNTGDAIDGVYALYPYSVDAELLTSGVIKSSLPAVQSYALNSFGRGANTMVAVTESADDNSLSFRNVGGFLKLKIYGDATIKRIELSGNNGERIAGNATIEPIYNSVPEVVMADDASTHITLDCDNGVKLGASSSSATQFWFVLPATVFEKGITIKVESVDGAVYEHTTSKRVEIERNTIQPMSPFEPKFAVPTPADNQIWYTTTDGRAVEFDSSDFSSEMVSNNYSAGRGVITFEQSVERIGNNAFKGCATLKSITLSNAVRSIGSEAFSGCSSLQDIYLPEGLTTIGDRAFYECRGFDILTIPSTITSFGGYVFYHAEANQLVVNCSVPDADAQLNESSMVFTSTYFESVTFTSSVRRIGSYSFGWNSYISNIDFGYGIEQIGEGAFCYNTSLGSVTLPATITSIGKLSFYGCNRLETITCRATSVPTLGDDAFPASVVIYVPDASVMAYNADDAWKKYSIYNLTGEEYESSDFSADGEVVVLQMATEGNGIDIVMMGDGYSDRQIEAGYYLDDLTRTSEMLFTEEPYKSFKHLFNIYAVKCVSRNEGIVDGRKWGSTAFNCKFDDSSTLIKGDEWVPQEYAVKAIGEERTNEMMAIVILNSMNYGGTCYMTGPEDSPNESNCWGNGRSVSYFSLCGDDDVLRKLMLHEAGGHGFAKLADEYFSSGSGSISYEDYYLGEYFEDYGWYRNVDYVYNEDEFIDETNVKWHHFLEDERYQYDGLGVYEGAYTYAKNAYRPTDESIMRHNEGGFNAPSREAIYIRLHKLAYGSDWVYDYEDFVKYDAINRKSAPAASATLSSVVYCEQLPHTPPIILR